MKTLLLLCILSLGLSSCKSTGSTPMPPQIGHTIALEALQKGSFNVDISSIHIYEGKSPTWKQVTGCYFKYQNGQVDFYCSPSLFRHRSVSNSRIEEKAELTFKKKKKNGNNIFVLKLIPKHMFSTSEWEITLYNGSNECEFTNREFGREGLERCNFKGKVYPPDGE